MISILEHLLDQKKSFSPSEHDFIAFLFLSGQNLPASTKSPKSRFLRFSWKFAFPQFFLRLLIWSLVVQNGDLTCLRPVLRRFLTSYRIFEHFVKNWKNRFWGRKIAKIDFGGIGFTIWVQKNIKNHQNSSAYPSAISKIKT